MPKNTSLITSKLPTSGENVREHYSSNWLPAAVIQYRKEKGEIE